MLPAFCRTEPSERLIDLGTKKISVRFVSFVEEISNLSKSHPNFRWRHNLQFLQPRPRFGEKQFNFAKSGNRTGHEIRSSELKGRPWRPRRLARSTRTSTVRPTRTNGYPVARDAGPEADKPEEAGQPHPLPANKRPADRRLKSSGKAATSTRISCTR